MQMSRSEALFTPCARRLGRHASSHQRIRPISICGHRRRRPHMHIPQCIDSRLVPGHRSAQKTAAALRVARRARSLEARVFGRVYFAALVRRAPVPRRCRAAPYSPANTHGRAEPKRPRV